MPADSTPTVAVFGTLRFAPERIAELKPHLNRLIEATYAHDRCIAYDVAEDLREPGLLRFAELWPNQATLERHLHAPHIAPWRAAAQACGLLERHFTAYAITGSLSV